MRIFAPDRIKGMMGRFGIPEDEPIKNKFVTRAIESAQTKIEGFNFDARKHLLEFDDVLNQQRQAIYKKRKRLLLGDAAVLEEFLKEAIEKAEDRISVEKEVEGKKTELGDDFWTIFRAVSLKSIDMLWVEHLEMMDYLRVILWC